MIAIYILFSIIIVSGIILIVRAINIASLFQTDGNPYRRHCKLCGSCQIMFQSNIEGNEDDFWWEEAYPIGNDEKCKCHSYSEYRY